ncbi:MAG: endolytic transglycosylase MltG [Paracoccaceae bacterium]
MTLLVAGAVVLAVVVVGARHQVADPGPLAAETVVEIPRGTGLAEATAILEEAGAIDNPLLFRLAARYAGADRRLKAGEYRLDPGVSIETLLATLTSGRAISYRVTVAEGLTSYEVVEILRDSDVLEGEIETLPAEGSLAPDTYFVSRGDTRAAVIERMQAAQAEILETAWRDRDAGLPLDTSEEALILASIVEKETGLGEERPQVASVFVNRLRRGMRLQSDPTVIYGITEGRETLGRGLRRSELNERTPYNTYAIDGLPPTPIANPGQAAIEAVTNPASTPYYYFVADGSGGHAFAETLAEHNANVAEWRRIERQRRADGQ